MAAVINYNFWRDQYDGDANAIGKIIQLEGLPFTVTGVTPKDLFGLEVGSSSEMS
jgi:hypothetical protein